MRAVIASGSGRYADPWHRSPETTPPPAGPLGGAGCAVEIGEDADGAMPRLAGVGLLVVNAGDLLGHDARSYDSEGHHSLIANLATWAART